MGNHLWQTTVAAAVIWLLNVLLHKNPAPIRYSLWLAASLKFLLPFSLLITLGSLLPSRSRSRRLRCTLRLGSRESRSPR